MQSGQHRGWAAVRCAVAVRGSVAGAVRWRVRDVVPLLFHFHRSAWETLERPGLHCPFFNNFLADITALDLLT
jgi:hypothetical protein